MSIPLNTPIGFSRVPLAAIRQMNDKHVSDDQHEHHHGLVATKPATEVLALGPSVGEHREIDPVCGMKVDPATAKHRHSHEGMAYYFCSAKCRAKFMANPGQYVKPMPQLVAPVPAGAIYTCPMHPQIRQSGPGSCPICGMALEPELASAQSGPNAELADMTRRFWIGLGLSVPVLVLEMGGHLTGLRDWLGGQPSNWIQLVLATPVVLWAGWPFFERGWNSLKTRNLNMFTLIASSEHPLAAAIVRSANERGLALVPVENFDSPVGKGVTGSVEGHKLVIGNRRIMAEGGIDTSALDQDAEKQRGDGATAIYVAVDGKVAGIFAIADPIKATTPAAIAALTADGIRVVMLTGDNATTANAVARKLGITDVEADVLPGDKSKVVERFRKQGRIVVMAGDGVNDAPALAAADVGIAMGTGTDVAVESAGVTLLKGDLNGIVRARHLSAATMANIRQNLFFAFIYNAAGVPIAAGVLYPVFGVLLSPIIAAAAMALSSVSVIGNSLRLRQTKL